MGRVGKPLLDPWTAALVVLGVAYALLRAFRPSYLLLLLWLLVPLLVCILTVDAPFIPHMIIALPALAVFPALVLDSGWGAVERLAGRAGSAVFMALALVGGALALYANYESYFEEHVKTVRIARFPTLVSRYLRDVADGSRVYLVSHSLSLDYETVRFLVPNLDGEDLEAPPRLPLENPLGKQTVFVVDVAGRDWRRTLASLERHFPRGAPRLHRDARGEPVFISYVVRPASS